MHVRPCASDRYYDARGQSGQYRQCHETADLIFSCRVKSGVAALAYQGGYMCANDLQYIKELGIGLGRSSFCASGGTGSGRSSGFIFCGSGLFLGSGLRHGVVRRLDTGRPCGL